MSSEEVRGRFEKGNAQNGGGLKRRDVLRSGSSLLAASVLPAIVVRRQRF
jgi:hypothetical protein